MRATALSEHKSESSEKSACLKPLHWLWRFAKLYLRHFNALSLYNTVKGSLRPVGSLCSLCHFHVGNYTVSLQNVWCKRAVFKVCRVFKFHFVPSTKLLKICVLIIFKTLETWHLTSKKSLIEIAIELHNGKCKIRWFWRLAQSETKSQDIFGSAASILTIFLKTVQLYSIPIFNQWSITLKQVYVHIQYLWSALDFLGNIFWNLLKTILC